MKAFFFTLCFLVSGCYLPSSELHHFRGVAMEMPYHVQIGGSLSEKQRAHIQSILLTSFAFIHVCFNHWNPYSELSLINQLPLLRKKKLSPRLLQLFTVAQEMTLLSEGHFNPALGFLTSRWKKSLAESVKIDPKILECMQSHLLQNAISIEDGMVYKNVEIQLDFDGIAKGLGIDLILERLRGCGYRNVYVDWAGDIATCGNHPRGRRWQIAIRNPLSPIADSEIIPLANSAIATSGDYEQCGEIEGKKYSHIINPFTFYPMEIQEGSIASVTVRAPSCALADGLATSAMTFSKIENALAWARQVKKRMPTVSFWIFERHYSQGKPEVKKHTL